MANQGMDVLGATELMKVLDDLPNDLGVKVLKDINRSGATIYRNEIKSAAPVGDDRIYKAIKIQNDRTDGTGLLVGVGSKAFWARFIEFGTTIRRTKGKGEVQKKAASRGKMNAKPFVAPAIEGSTERAIEAIFNKMGKRVFLFLKRETKKVNKAG